MTNKPLFSFFLLVSCMACGGKGSSSDDVLSAREGAYYEDEATLNWKIETLPSTGWDGEYSRLQIDSSGNPMIAHIAVSPQNASEYAFHLAQFDGNSWKDTPLFETTGKSSFGFFLQGSSPLISYFDVDDLRFYSNGSSVPINTNPGTGEWSSLVVGASGKIMSSYQACMFSCNDYNLEGTHDLRFAYKLSNSSWSFETVEAGAEQGVGDITKASNSGYYTTVVLRNDQPIISFFNRAQRKIKIAIHSGAQFNVSSNWKIIDVVASINGGDSRPSLAVSSQGVLGISFYKPWEQDLFYTESFDGGLTWRAPEKVDASIGNQGSLSDLKFDSQGNPTIVYYDDSERNNGQGLKIAWKTNSQWKTATILQGRNIGQDPSFQFNSQGRPLISFFDGGGGKLMYAEFQDSIWPPVNIP